MKKLAFILPFLVTSCASIDTSAKWQAESNKGNAHILVFREEGSHSSALPMYFGPDDYYVLKLNERQYSKFDLTEGNYKFRVNTHASKSSTVNVNLEAKGTICVEGSANPNAWFSAIFPPLIPFIPSFNVNIVKCPTQSTLAKMTPVTMGKQED